MIKNTTYFVLVLNANLNKWYLFVHISENNFIFINK